MIRYDITEGGGRRLKNWFDLFYLFRQPGPSAAEVTTISQLVGRGGKNIVH